MSVEHPKRDLAFKWLQVPRTYVYILKIHTKNCYQARGRREIWQKKNSIFYFWKSDKNFPKKRGNCGGKIPFSIIFFALMRKLCKKKKAALHRQYNQRFSKWVSEI
jgi:hypothetical protein